MVTKTTVIEMTYEYNREDSGNGDGYVQVR